MRRLFNRGYLNEILFCTSTPLFYQDLYLVCRFVGVSDRPGKFATYMQPAGARTVCTIYYCSTRMFFGFGPYDTLA